MKEPEFPRLRWAGAAWLAVWVPVYWDAWGWKNFLLLCDIAVILTCIGLWRGNRLLLSSQAVSSLVVDLSWCIDFVTYWVFGLHVVGGTEYMWNPEFSVLARALSSFHVLLPVVLLASLRRLGYDRRGFWLQSAIAAGVLAVSRTFPGELNINFSHRDPIFSRSWGPAPIHLAVTLSTLIGIIYWPTHRLLHRFFSAPKKLTELSK